MSTTSKTPLLSSSPPQQQPPTYVILQYYPYTNPNLRRTLLRILFFILSLLTLTLLIFLFYPSDPELRLVRVKLNHIRVQTRTHPPSLDLSLLLQLRVRNRDLFSLAYRSLTVAISYRGRKLGFVSSHGGVIGAKQSSYVNATLDVNGFEVLHDLFYLIEDLASGFVPFDTVSVVDGYLGVLFIQFPFQAKVSCEVDVNPRNQKIVHQNCYPEGQCMYAPRSFERTQQEIECLLHEKGLQDPSNWCNCCTKCSIVLDKICLDEVGFHMTTTIYNLHDDTGIEMILDALLVSKHTTFSPHLVLQPWYPPFAVDSPEDYSGG
ncbi:hypothetical protein KSS87_011428 [Heliosperma pusillum]|nr:hypothetical protein KSS87_011428 [Heliosperma pusillum]